MLPLESTLKLAASVPVSEYVPAGFRITRSVGSGASEFTCRNCQCLCFSAVTVAVDVKVSLSVSVIVSTNVSLPDAADSV